MSDLPTKEHLKEELARLVAADLATRERSHKAAREGATHEEAKPENDKDTRALEQSYLARGEALRVEELKVSLAEVQSMPLRAVAEGEPAALGALVLAEEDGESILLWLAPYGGGNRLADGRVQIVTPKSPLGRALIGKCAGEECEVKLAGRNRVLTIERVE
jgi:transcription elongation GreA/GreB family factor